MSWLAQGIITFLIVFTMGMGIAAGVATIGKALDPHGFWSTKFEVCIIELGVVAFTIGVLGIIAGLILALGTFLLG